MATYKSTPHTINLPVETAYDNVSNLARLQDFMNQLPQEQLSKIGEVRFTEDSIVIKAAAVGEITLKMTERVAPTHVKFAAAGVPVKMETSVNLSPASVDSTNLITELDVDVPAMLKPMVGPKMQEAADKMADMIAMLLNR